MPIFQKPALDFQARMDNSFTLDESIDSERISARYENGVLWLSLPKKEDSQRQRRTIEIQ